MRKELTVILVFVLGLSADGLWFGQNQAGFGLILFLQIVLAIFLLMFIAVAAKKFLLKYPSLRPKFALVSIWKNFRLKFQPNLWKRQTSVTKV